MPSRLLPGPTVDGIQRLLQRYATDLRVDQASVWLASEDGQGQVVRAAGTSATTPDAGHQLVVERGGPLIVNDIANEPLITLGGPGVRSALGIPLTDATNVVVGALLATSSTERTWSNAEIERGGDVAAVLAGIMEIAKLLHRVGERAETAYEIAQAARTLQESLLPLRLPSVDGLEIGRLYAPAAENTAIGGDWYDVIPVAEGVSGFVVGDVAGHDMRSAAVMGQVRHVLASQLRDRGSPATALLATDRYFADIAENVMATAVVFTIDQRGHVELALAGHPPPIHITAGSALALDTPPGPPLGLGYGSYADHSLDLEFGEALVGYTDGVIERRYGDLRTHIQRLATALQQANPDVNGWLEALKASTARTGAVDDAAALAVQRVTQ